MGWFTDALESVAPIAGAVGGAILGGAPGAALGNIVGTELATGGRAPMGQVATGAGLSYLGAGLMGAGWTGAPSMGSLGAGAGAGSSDPIEAIYQLTAGNNMTATEAAAAKGFPSVEAYLSSINPAWVSGGAPVSERGFNATRGPANNSFMDALRFGPSYAMSSLGLNLGGGAGAMPWNSPAGMLTLGSGLYGLSEAQRLKRLSAAMIERADPFGPNRAFYAGKLNELTANPEAVLPTLPGYRAGLDAVQRSLAAQGYQGSGNMMAALQKYGGDFYNQALNQYGTLAGAQFSPAAAAQVGLEGRVASSQLTGNALQRLAYGSYMAGR